MCVCASVSDSLSVVSGDNTHTHREREREREGEFRPMHVFRRVYSCTPDDAFTSNLNPRP